LKIYSLQVYTTRKTSWNPAGVEPVHSILGISTPAHVLVVQIGKGLQFGMNGTNQTKDEIRGRNPASKKVLGWFAGRSVCSKHTHVMLHRAPHSQYTYGTHSICTHTPHILYLHIRHTLYIYTYATHSICTYMAHMLHRAHRAPHSQYTYWTHSIFGHTPHILYFTYTTHSICTHIPHIL